MQRVVWIFVGLFMLGVLAMLMECSHGGHVGLALTVLWVEVAAK